VAQEKVVDVAELLETRQLGRFQIGIWSLAFLMVFVDGFDLSGPLVGAPALICVWLGLLYQRNFASGEAGAVAAAPMPVVASISVRAEAKG